MTWQTIDTAPKDGTRVLLFNPDEMPSHWGVMTGEFYLDDEFWRYDGESGGYSHAHQPTHWMPLPEPPA